MLVRDSVRVRSGVVGRAVVCFGVMLLLSCSVAYAQQGATPKRILALYWSTKDFPGNAQFDQSLQAALKSSPTWTEYYPEYWDTDRFPGEDQARLLHDYLRQKYAGHTIDVVLALGDRPLDFLLKYREDLFPTAPILFFVTKVPSPGQLAAGPGMTGFVSLNAYRETLDLALRMHPRT
ncbi:MAG: hypothetical protein ACREAC_09175, partial [Blastocatellia bacterium]